MKILHWQSHSRNFVLSRKILHNSLKMEEYQSEIYLQGTYKRLMDFIVFLSVWSGIKMLFVEPKHGRSKSLVEKIECKINNFICMTKVQRIQRHLYIDVL